MDGIKSFFASKTIWGSIVALAATILPLLGFDFSTEDGSALTSAIDEIIAALGVIYAIYGRVVATKAIT